jgi:hypothetical protein
MPDREKVIKGLEVCFDSSKECNGCPYIITPYCKTTLRNDILALLKEQEAVEPIYIENPYTHLPVSYCSKCREPINQYITGNPYRKTEYCHYCGQAVKWE